MCGRFTLSSPGEAVAEIFGLPDVPEIPPRYNIAPTQPAAVVLLTTGKTENASEEKGTGSASKTVVEGVERSWSGTSALFRCLRIFRWGLVPSWADDPAIGAKMINARAESVATKPSFRSAFRKRRCLVVADGFYEWKKLVHGKRPYYIRLKDDGPFAFAGLWDRWQGPGPDTIDSFAILTTGPNELVARLHDRMPVILHPKDYAFWLDANNEDVPMLEALLRPYPAEQMSAYQVRPLVNNPTFDGPACIVPTP